MLFRILKTFFIFSIFSFLTIFFIELYLFKENILSFKKYSNKENSNIVILTGGTNRIKDGLRIVNDFKNLKKFNFKILVSGTGRGFTKSSLIQKIDPNLDSKFIKCCIDLDSVSKNTFTNARETSKWAKKNNIKEFILITSNYHMPRAILEFQNIMPDHQIFTFPIKPKKHNIEEWLYSYKTFNLVFIEFCKYIISSMRIRLLKI